MTDAPTPLNRSAHVPDQPTYPKPAFGNPTSTLMESGVGNCFPGLEFDVRGLDARFFPGLVFEFPGCTPAGPDGRQGASLYFVDTSNDPMLAGGEDWVGPLNAAYGSDAGSALGDNDADNPWYLHWIEQGEKRIEMYEFTYYQNSITPVAYEGETVWWIIRMIAPNEPLTIALTKRDAAGAPAGAPVVLHGQRRTFVNPDGLFDTVYQPGELTASMCSPWTHDFRDCACHYWASNHPDIALGETDLPEDAAQPVTFLDWMRRRDLPSVDVSAAATIGEARPRRYDPYEINLKWQELSFVLEGRETSNPYGELLDLETPPNKFEGADAVIEALTEHLAPLELTLALEYLYAYFSLKTPEEGRRLAADWPTLEDDLRAARQLLLMTAISEMTHLRWANQMLWILLDAMGKKYEPVLVMSPTVPAIVKKQKSTRPAELRILTEAILQEFIDVERPGKYLDTEYAGIVAEMREKSQIYPEGLYQIAVRIDTDGLQHFHRFQDIQRILRPYQNSNPPVHLRELKQGSDADTKLARDLVIKMIVSLKAGYTSAFQDQMPAAKQSILDAREAMEALRVEAERLAALGIGVPFFDAVNDA